MRGTLGLCVCMWGEGFSVAGVVGARVVLGVKAGGCVWGLTRSHRGKFNEETNKGNGNGGSPWGNYLAVGK